MLTHTEYIRKWVEKSRDETDNFDRFVYGFFAFNALYSEHYTGESSERYAIKEFLNDNFVGHESEFKAIFELPEYEYFCNRRPIKNMRYDPNSGQGYQDTRRETEAIKEKVLKKSTKAMIMILYQIRCNLFHGEKSFANESDREVMRNASELLLRYNEIFIKGM